MLALARLGVDKDTIAVLHFLLAKATTGRLRGMAVSYRTDDGIDKVLFTGVHELRPENAVTAATKMQLIANNRLDL